MPISRRLGSLTITALEDGAGPFFTPRRDAFPTATDAQWTAADAFDPGSVTADGRWWLRFRAFAIVDGYGRTTIVDAGIGPADPDVDAWTPVPGRLPSELAAAGIDVDAVETVVLTHLHSDHTGWAVVPGERAEPLGSGTSGLPVDGAAPAPTGAAKPSPESNSAASGTERAVTSDKPPGPAEPSPGSALSGAARAATPDKSSGTAEPSPGVGAGAAARAVQTGLTSGTTGPAPSGETAPAPESGTRATWSAAADGAGSSSRPGGNITSGVARAATTDEPSGAAKPSPESNSAASGTERAATSDKPPGPAEPSPGVGAGGRRAFFPNARYVVQRADAASLAPQQDERLLAPLRRGGQLHVVEGDHRLSHEMTTVHTPGHTPGHQSVLLSHGTDSMLLTGDLLVHAVQLLYPEQPYAHEDDPALACRTRQRFLERLRRGDGVLATSHLTEAFLAHPTRS